MINIDRSTLENKLILIDRQTFYILYISVMCDGRIVRSVLQVYRYDVTRSLETR
jgi:hypothetical protein